MKKILLLVVPMFVLCLTGCEEKEGEIVCNGGSKDVINGYEIDSKYVITYKGDYVTMVESKETVESDLDSVLSYFDETLNETYEKMDDTYGGYTYKITKEADKVISDVTIDYSDMDIKQLVKDQPTYKAFVKNDKLLVDGIITIYESMGITCDR